LKSTKHKIFYDPHKHLSTIRDIDIRRTQDMMQQYKRFKIRQWKNSNKKYFQQQIF